MFNKIDFRQHHSRDFVAAGRAILFDPICRAEQATG
jgi:hypothetical protein